MLTTIQGAQCSSIAGGTRRSDAQTIRAAAFVRPFECPLLTLEGGSPITHHILSYRTIEHTLFGTDGTPFAAADGGLATVQRPPLIEIS